MSFSSRGLLTKIYDTTDGKSHSKKKQKIGLSFNSLGKQKKAKLKNLISSTINEKENENEDDSKYINNTNNKKNINKNRIKSLLEENNSSKFPIIPQLNITNIKNTNENKSNNTVTKENKKQDILEKDVKLNYKMIESTSEEDQFPLRGLKKGLDGLGWQSARFCQYPQYIYVQFSQPVLIKRIDLVLHETNIPSLIKFHSYIPKDKDDYISNYLQVNYDYLGFIRTDSNERSNFRSRESRKVFINSKALFLKIELEKNYFNKYNLFNQVGLLKLDFFGDYLPYIGGNIKSNKLILKHALKRNIYNDMDLDTICGQQLTELKKQMNYNIEIENYLECKEIKNKIEKVRLYGKRIFELESEKTIAINNEDFSKAIEIKNLVDKLKLNLQNIDNMPNSPRLNDTHLILSDRDNQSQKNKKFSNIAIDLNNYPGLSNSYEISALNESIHSLNDNNHYNISYKNNNSISNNSLFPDNNNLYISEDIYGSYDDTILPTVLKKLKNEEIKKEDEIGEAEKGELEEISPKILQEYILITNVIGEENMRKIFSKHILWKEEGLKFFIDKIDNILKNNNNNNEIISSILQLSMILLEEKHPSIVIKTLEIIKKLFEYIKKNNITLNIKGEITDGLLIKIKEKLGDVNPKVRTKSVSLYCYMLSLSFCDYNNLISELVEEEIKNNNKYMPKSSNLILGKLDIFINIFNNFDDAINMKRTDKQKFPSALVMEYLICNISHNKPEVRRKTIIAMKLFLNVFEISKFKKKLEKIEERELSKLINEIPDLQNYFPDIIVSNRNKSETVNISKSRGNSYNSEIMPSIIKKKVSKLFLKKDKKVSKKRLFLKSKFVSPVNTTNGNEDKKENNNNINNIIITENINNENNKENNDIKENKKIKDYCSYCKKNLNEGEILANHWTSDCPIFTRCEKCSLNLEIKKLNHHRGNECKFKEEYKLCNKCNEYILKDELDSHKKSKCNLKPGCVKCPLCHKDINDSHNDFYQHLVSQGCPFQNRKL